MFSTYFVQISSERFWDDFTRPNFSGITLFLHYTIIIVIIVVVDVVVIVVGGGGGGGSICDYYFIFFCLSFIN